LVWCRLRRWRQRVGGYKKFEFTGAETALGSDRGKQRTEGARAYKIVAGERRWAYEVGSRAREPRIDDQRRG
jgi:hypothetical protein